LNGTSIMRFYNRWSWSN